MSEITAPLIDVIRHRMGTDGIGVTSLVALHGCPLRCKYCINQEVLLQHGPQAILTPEQLLDSVRVDDLYFAATNGGICFGGGEPLLHSAFIHAFCEIKPKTWRITLETSLHIPLENLQQVAKDIDLFFIDIKDADNEIYQRYTGKTNTQVIANLRWMAAEGLADRVIIRLPLIPNYNHAQQLEASQELFQKMGFTRFNPFRYILK